MDLASLQEANRLRESMGLKPLPLPGQAPAAKGPDEEDEDPLGTLDGRHAAGYENFQKLQEAERAKRDREERAEAVKRAREKAQRHALLQGQTLADVGDDDKTRANADADADAKAWLRGQKKRQKQIAQAEALAAQQAEAEAARKRAENGDDLTGLKVGHDVAALLDGDDQVLTLRDATVLENEDEGDELENLSLRERERLQERLDLKKKRPGYDPLLDDDGSGEGGRTILGQYDEEISGKKRKHFTLDPNAILGLGGGGGDGSNRGVSLADASTSIAAGSGAQTQAQQQQNASIDDILTGGPSSDYLDVSEIKIKKPKKKSKTKKATKVTRQRGADDDDVLFPAAASGLADGEDAANSGESNGGQMEVDEAATAAELAVQTRKRKIVDDDDEIFRDEDSLHAALAVQRREALKKRKRMRPEDLAKQLREASAAPQSEGGENGETGEDGTPNLTEGGGVGLIIDETAEFVSNIKRREDRDDEVLPRVRKPVQRASSVTVMDAEESDEGDDVAMKDEDEKDGDDHGDAKDTAHLGPGLEEEKKISEGLGATLAILRDRGILYDEKKHKRAANSAGAGHAVDGNGRGDDDDDDSPAARNRRLRAHQQFVAEKRARLAQLDEEARRRREQDRTSGPMARMSAREREEYARKQNAQREFQTSRMLQDMFNKEYTPNFKLEYVDDYGRELNQKEAFRELSHGFHGKTSGRGKTDKMLKRIEAEKRHMAEGILDASQSVGMSSATAQQLKKRKEAGVRLD
ncbi:DNA-binding protein [Niveomyces insectorum RCEF 264]|uniref:DNA-binding protein n=1 Tax=Niveomyces insectorum RCEF 264 TaxID=1081102 RepID=A0A167NU25_9HYPO|nr:DNA-binding protein [Niveomyces insectorum RCEF 264]